MPETIHLAVGIALAVSFIAMGAAFQSFYGDEPVVREEFVQNYCNNNKACVDFMTKHYVTNSSFKTHNAALITIFDKLDKKVDGLQGSVTLLQAQGDVTTLPSPTPPTVNTIILNLELSDNGFNVKPSGYPRDVGAILITGQSEFIDRAYLITITSPDGSFVKDKFGKTLSDGDVSEAWVPLDSQRIPGTYKVTITIDNKSDSIEFTLL